MAVGLCRANQEAIRLSGYSTDAELVRLHYEDQSAAEPCHQRGQRLHDVAGEGYLYRRNDDRHAQRK